MKTKGHYWVQFLPVTFANCAKAFLTEHSLGIVLWLVFVTYGCYAVPQTSKQLTSI